MSNMRENDRVVAGKSQQQLLPLKAIPACGVKATAIFFFALSYFQKSEKINVKL
jgi:hypothetical protein